MIIFVGERGHKECITDMKTTLSVVAALLLGTSVRTVAQEPFIERTEQTRTLLERVKKEEKVPSSVHMNFHIYTSGAANFLDGKLDDASFKLNRVRLELLGNIGNRFSYHFRQSYNKDGNPRSQDNIAASVEYAYVNWKVSDRFSLTGGKQIVALGGYEYYVNAIKVREFSDFNNYISCYQAGLAGNINLTPTQELVLQVVNNRNGSDEDSYRYGRPEGLAKSKAPLLGSINWNGFFADRALHLRYAASWAQLAERRNLFYLTAGNIWERGPVMAYLDLMYSREGLDSKGLLTDLQGDGIVHPMTAQHAEYFTVIGNFNYHITSKWNVYVKGTYETGNIYKSSPNFEKGRYRTSWNAQACVEYFPMKGEELLVFLHYMYKGCDLKGRAKALGGNPADVQRISIGLSYAIPVF